MFKIKNQSSTSLSPTKVPLILALQNIYCNHHVHSPLNSKSKYIGISVAVTLLWGIWWGSGIPMKHIWGYMSVCISRDGKYTMYMSSPSIWPVHALPLGWLSSVRGAQWTLYYTLATCLFLSVVFCHTRLSVCGSGNVMWSSVYYYVLSVCRLSSSQFPAIIVYRGSGAYLTLSLVGNIPRQSRKIFFVPMLKRMFTSQIRCSHGEHDVHQVNIAISI